MVPYALATAPGVVDHDPNLSSVSLHPLFTHSNLIHDEVPGLPGVTSPAYRLNTVSVLTTAQATLPLQINLGSHRSLLRRARPHLEHRRSENPGSLVVPLNGH